MGCGIAQLCAQSGFAVKVFDSQAAALQSLPDRLKKGLDAGVLRGKLTTHQAERAFHSVAASESLEGLYGAELIIEAAAEDLAAKKDIFSRLDAACPDGILATNTSSLSVAGVAEAVEHPERVLGIHFFNPPVAMKLVEMVRTPQTAPSAFREAWDFVLSGLRRTPVDVKDTPGFIVNRVMRPYYLECQRAAARGSGIAALDEAARKAGGVPMGPFELMDLIGLDVNLAITKSLYEALGRPDRFKPQPLQEKLVAMGQTGRKAGRGFYVHNGKDFPFENPEAAALVAPAGGASASDAWHRVIGAVIAEAQMVFEEGSAGKADIDLAIKLAMNFPKGPFEWQKAGEPKAA